MTFLVLGVTAVFLLGGVGIAYVIGAGSVLGFIAAGQDIYLAVLPQRIFSQLDLFALMALPLFILTGEIMNRSGITRVIVNLMMALVGRVKGGLGHANILTSVFFGGVSGSAIADTAALSNTLVPAMVERGYRRSYAAALTAASSIIGPIIPPSIILILYGALMETSVTALFVAGIVPGLLLAASLMVANAICARREDHREENEKDDPVLSRSIIAALPALSLPVIILGGIVGGVTTPTEAAAIAVVAALIVGSRQDGMNAQIFWQAVQTTVRLTGSVFMILAAVAVFGYLAGLLQWPQSLAGWVSGTGLSGLELLLAINLLFLVVGMVLDLPVALFLIVPVIAPLALAQGVDPTHLGIVLCFNLCIGLTPPPFGACLAVTASVAGVEYKKIARAVLTFVAAEILVLGCLILFPQISLFLPRLAGFVAG
ncbi:MAG: TRAP transporter large permease subunit [Alphaproteobacteria bacterium]|nr:TRAP transporter large permease subunit [Alphaproteobacteria bacterium]